MRKNCLKNDSVIKKELNIYTKILDFNIIKWKLTFSSHQLCVEVLVSHLQTGDLGVTGGELVSKEAERFGLGRGMSERW